jgi:hypothetical protein
MRVRVSYALDGVVIAVPRAGWTSRIPNYRGVAATSWWPLEQHAKRDQRAKELSGVLSMRWVSGTGDWLKPHATTDLEFLRSYVEACDRLEIAPLRTLVCASPGAAEAAPEWLTGLQEGCDYLGIDVTYPDGGFSFVHDDFSPSNGEVLAFLKDRLNDRGLFNSEQDVNEFMRLHQAMNDRGANLETLDQDVYPVALWEDCDLSKLRAIIDSENTSSSA